MVRGTTQEVVRVGIQGDEANAEHDGELTNLQLGTIHEYGAPLANIPERSFVRATVDENAAAYVRLARRLGQQVLDGARTRRQALGLFGERVRADIVNRINRGIEPALRPATVARKKSSKPLVDTSQLKGAITYVVGDR
jgi:hypothetical protein